MPVVRIHGVPASMHGALIVGRAVDELEIQLCMPKQTFQVNETAVEKECTLDDERWLSPWQCGSLCFAQAVAWNIQLGASFKEMVTVYSSRVQKLGHAMVACSVHMNFMFVTPNDRLVLRKTLLNRILPKGSCCINGRSPSQSYATPAATSLPLAWAGDWTPRGWYDA